MSSISHLGFDSCPFCGHGDGHVISEPIEVGTTRIAMECERCGSRGPWIDVPSSMPTKTRTHLATYKWNERVYMKYLEDTGQDLMRFMRN